MISRLSALALACTAFLVAPANALGAINNVQVAQAIQRRVCFESYWTDHRAYRLGTTVPFVVRRDGDVAYAWTQNLSATTGSASWVDFFTVYAKSDRVSVGEAAGLSGTNVVGIQERMRRVKGSRPEIVQVAVPSDCAPHFTVSTPERDRTLAAIGSSVAKAVATAQSADRKRPAAREEMLVASFLSDYPATYVLVPRTQQVFRVTLQDASDPLGDAALVRGDYAVARVDSATEAGALKVKIRKYGIAREF